MGSLSFSNLLQTAKNMFPTLFAALKKVFKALVSGRPKRKMACPKKSLGQKTKKAAPMTKQKIPSRMSMKIAMKKGGAKKMSCRTKCSYKRTCREEATSALVQTAASRCHNKRICYLAVAEEAAVQAELQEGTSWGRRRRARRRRSARRRAPARRRRTARRAPARRRRTARRTYKKK